METHKPLLKDADGEDIDEHIYLKGQPKLGLWYRKDLPFDLVAYTDSDYAGASLDRKSTTRGCQFLRCRLISWQCKKQTVVANSITEAEYVAVSRIGVNAGNSKLMLLGINLLLLGINLLLLEKVNAARHNLLLLVLTLMGYEKLSQKLTFYKAFFSPQWKFLIHTILQCLSAKTTAWNEFSSQYALKIICLANNQKFNFSKYIFESMMKNLDSAVKFLMYPRFVQVFLDNQLEGMMNHNKIYIAPSHTEKVFANIKRQGKDFSGRVTPLFSTMTVQAQQEQGEGSDMPTITQPSSSQPQKKHKPRKPKKKDTQIPQSNVSSDNLAVLDLEHTKTTQALEIDNLKRRVKKLEKKQRSRTHGLRRLYKVGLSARVVSSKDEGVFNDEEVFAAQDMAEKEVSTADPVTTAGEVVTTANVEVSTASPTAATITTVELTLAQTLAELKSARPKTKGVVMQEPSETTTTTITIPSKDKGKGIMVEEPLKMKKKDQVLFVEQEAIRLQAQFDKEERIAREKEEDNAALIA
ncbi:hypothetical protein Tco_0227677 [Tanacetum coccineum]